MQRNERPSRLVRESSIFRREAEALGRRLREIRKAQKLTLEELSERADVSAKALQKIEMGKGNVTLVTLYRLADGLRQPIAVLFGGLVLDPAVSRDDATDDTPSGADERGKMPRKPPPRRR